MSIKLSPSSAGETTNAIRGGSGTVIASASHAIVETSAGKVRGCIRNGIYTFKGIVSGTRTTALYPAGQRSRQRQARR